MERVGFAGFAVIVTKQRSSLRLCRVRHFDQLPNARVGANPLGHLNSRATLSKHYQKI
jgi:hypothetical protein